MTPAIFGIAGLELTVDERAFFKDANPAGYILFARNCDNPQQLRRLTDDLRELHGRERLFISVDQEGGRVQRMKPPQWTAYPAGEAFDLLYRTAPASAIEAARVNAEALAIELAEMGVTVDFHPPLDVRQPGTHDVIGDRALGSDPMQVAAIGRAILDGLARGGVVGCIKHMPGHGRSMCDSHKEMPRVEASEDELEQDLAPFRALRHAPMGMTGHLLFTAWDAENPATLSPFIVGEIIRKRIGFGGLLLTDDIDMEALSGTIPERAARANAAGCDLVLNCWARMDDMMGIANALPRMSELSAERLDRALSYAAIPGESTGRTQLLAKRDALMAAAGEAA
ncbi:MAG: beta-N-acetylhexosaminidase [Alphaproteobacteria bacterium]|nr:MAG: beta-N-acetylhexosaminidase [Alphaproteobacteria bacterium]